MIKRGAFPNTVRIHLICQVAISSQTEHTWVLWYTLKIVGVVLHILQVTLEISKGIFSVSCCCFPLSSLSSGMIKCQQHLPYCHCKWLDTSFSVSSSSPLTLPLAPLLLRLAWRHTNLELGLLSSSVEISPHPNLGRKTRYTAQH